MSPLTRMLRQRWVSLACLMVLTTLLSVKAGEVKPDYSIEQLFPRFDQSRVDYDRFKKEFPFEDARAIVIVEAKDLYTEKGLARVRALEAELAKLHGVVDTQSIASVRDLVSDGITLQMQKVFAEDASGAALQDGEKTVTTDPLYRFNLASPHRPATALAINLTHEVASKDELRNVFHRSALRILDQHRERARRDGIEQRLTLNGLPIIRSEFNAMIARDLGTLFPCALVIILGLLYVAFRRISDVFASLVTIVVSVIWTTAAMGILHIPIQALTQITPIVVMIISISDTVHVVTHTRELLAQGMSKGEAVLCSAKDSLIPCLLTEVTIAGGFLALLANDMLAIQQFGIATAIGMLLTWLANFTVLPVLLCVLPAGREKPRDKQPQEGLLRGFMRWLEQVVMTKPRRVVLTSVAVFLGFLLLGTQAGKEYYSYDDLRPEAPLRHDLRYVEDVIGGSVPMAVFIEPKTRTPDAMLEPEALALIDRVTRKLESEFGEDVKNASSLSKVVHKAHRLLVGDDIAKSEPLPKSRRLASQELLAVDDARTLRDIVNFDRSTAAVFAMVPDRGSSHATVVLQRLNQYLREEEARTGYKLTTTGIYGIADGIYRNLVGGLLLSLALAVFVSFAVFFVVLRSWQLALIALVPNVSPLVVTLGVMGALGIDIKPTTVIVFSITLVIADDDTIQLLSRFRTRFLEVAHLPDAHRVAVLDTMRASGVPMLVTTLAVAVGFLALLRSEFLGLAHLGLLMGVSLLSAVLADLFLTPILLLAVKPRLGPKAKGTDTEVAAAEPQRALV